MGNFVFRALSFLFKFQNIQHTKQKEANDIIEISLILPYKILKNGQTYFKHLAVWTPQNFYIMCGHFSTKCMKRLNKNLRTYWEDLEQVLYISNF